jgi:hypothetical protein
MQRQSDPYAPLADVYDLMAASDDRLQSYYKEWREMLLETVNECWIFRIKALERDEFTVNEPAFTRRILDFLETPCNEPSEVVEQIVWDNSNRFLMSRVMGAG